MDLVLIIAGYRPGPIKFLNSIAKVKSGYEGDLEYIPHSTRFPILGDILEETYGYFLFQEQVQKVAEMLAGFNDSEADDFRRVIAKKKKKEMPAQKAKFADGAKRNGLSEEEITHLLDEIDSFSAYAFNKSHAVAYSVLSVLTAWLKTNYPAEFYTSNIIHEIGSIDKVVALINDARKFGIKILPPDVNESGGNFSVVSKHEIRYGLSGIIGLGPEPARQIIDERNRNGPYLTVTDFIARNRPKINVVRNMIKAGCFDKMANRSQYLKRIDDDNLYIDKLVSFIKHVTDKGGVVWETDEEWIPLEGVIEYPQSALMDMEREVTNLWLTTTPTELYSEAIDELQRENDSYKCGIITDYKMFKNKTGLWFNLEGYENRFFIFKKVWSEIKDTFDPEYFKENVLGVRAWSPPDDDENKFIVMEYKDIQKDLSVKDKIITLIRLDNEGLKNTQALKARADELSDFPLQYQVIAKMTGDNYSKTVSLGYTNTI